MVLAEEPTRGALEVVEASATSGSPAISTWASAKLVAPGGILAYRVQTCGEPLASIPLLAGSRRVDLPVHALGGGTYEATFRPTLADSFRTYRAWGTGEPVVVNVTMEFLFLTGSAWRP